MTGSVGGSEGGRAESGKLDAMVYGASTQVFLPQRLHPGMLDLFADNGAQTIEIIAARYHFDYTDRAQVREIAGWFKGREVSASMHQPLNAETTFSRHAGATLELISRDKMRRIEAMEEVKRALEAAEQVPFSSCVLHMGTKADVWGEQALEYALTAIEHLKAFAAPLGVKLLLGNVPNEIATPEHLLEILRVGHFDSVGVCLDTGHANLAPGGVVAAANVLRGRIEEVHLNDNRGVRDEHLWPASGTERKSDFAAGTVDWFEAYAVLEGLGTEVRAVYEIAWETFPSMDAAGRMLRECLSHKDRLLEVRD